MKNSLSLALFAFLFITSVTAQVRPPVFPEDVESAAYDTDEVQEPKGIDGKSRSKGVTFNFTRVGGGEIDSKDGDLSLPNTRRNPFDRVAFKMKFPIVIGEKFKLLGGYRYITEMYDFDFIGENQKGVFTALDRRRLKSTGLELVGNYTRKDYSFIVFRVKMTANGDYRGMLNYQNRYQIYSAQVGYTKQKNDTYEWGIGLNFTTSFRRTIALPFFILNKNFNDKWGIESVLPAYFSLRYNPGPNTILLLGPQYNSASYSFDVPVGTDQSVPYNLNHSEFRFSLTVQQKIAWWLWLSGVVGYQNCFNTDFEYELGDEALDFQAEPVNTAYFRVGLFISPEFD